MAAMICLHRTGIKNNSNVYINVDCVVSVHPCSTSGGSFVNMGNENTYFVDEDAATIVAMIGVARGEAWHTVFMQDGDMVMARVDTDQTPIVGKVYSPVEGSS